KLVGAIDSLSGAVAAMREGDDPRLTLEVALLKVATPSLDSSREALLRRIETLESQIGGGGTAENPRRGAEAAAAPRAGAGGAGAGRAGGGRGGGRRARGARAGSERRRRRHRSGRDRSGRRGLAGGGGSSARLRLGHAEHPVRRGPPPGDRRGALHAPH